MSNVFDYTYLRGFIRDNFGSNIKFAKFLGIGTTILYARLANKVPFSQREIDRVATSALKNPLSAEEINKLFFSHKLRKTA